MSEMIERVARALVNRSEDRSLTHDVFWQELARAAIEAMREPSKAMKEAAAKIDTNDMPYGDPVYSWDVLISAALRDTG